MFNPKPGASGPEMMLRSLGLGEVLDAAKKMAEGGAIEKLLAFVDGIDDLNATLGRIEQNQRRLLQLAGQPLDVEVIEGTAALVGIRAASGEPGSGSGNSNAA